MRNKLAAYTLAAFGTVACGGDSFNPLSPSGTIAQNLQHWSPYVGVHTFGVRNNIQQPYLEPLIKSGKVKGIRVGSEGESERLAQWALDAGAEDVLGIFPNEGLRNNSREVFDSVVSANPSITHWEIGNEVNLDWPGFQAMSAREYVRIFTDLQRYAKEKYPDKTIIPAPPTGNKGGAKFLKESMDAGLAGLYLREDMPVLSIHYYDSGMDEFGDQVKRLPARTRVWVTETGINSDTHIEFVNWAYPRLQRELGGRVDRFYSYVFSECSKFALVRGLPPICATDPPTYSNLYKELLGDDEVVTTEQ